MQNTKSLFKKIEKCKELFEYDENHMDRIIIAILPK